MENVHLFELNATSAKRIIKEIAVNTERVIITDHVRLRMKQRRITTAQVLDCLRKGLVREEPNLIIDMVAGKLNLRLFPAEI